MLKKGLIVSIQNYSFSTTQELARLAIEGGAIAIRTDKPIVVNVPLIGLKKLDNFEYYITTTREAINQVSRWTNIIAIDSRKGNENINLLYAHCHLNELNIIADIEDVEDVKNILKICEEQKIMTPRYFATTFNIFNDDGIGDLIENILNITNIPIIAEGGIDKEDGRVISNIYNIHNICIGREISDIKKLTEKHVNAYKISD